ncbi:XRE family transcriptional regulator [Actinoplanes campanulatus]|uniref:XRE family transcriptional regulator n=1 Tax=Actinoplanes campanulatus TaxID=113559 RepID=UPI001EF1A673|nr:XRE family transcriptional regulator [Actinoplanes capillaceus]
MLANELLRAARCRTLSPSGSGLSMSRQELAEQVNAYLAKTYKLDLHLDENDIGKLERGENRWPREKRREAFRAVLHAATDAELGFYIQRRSRHQPADTLPEPCAISPAEAVIVKVVIDGREHVLRLSRRGLFEAVTGSLMAPLLGEEADELGPVDPAIVDHFATLRAVLVESDNRLGPATVLPTVRHQLGLIAQYRRQATGTLRDDLLSTEARWAEFAGWLCDDLGESGEGGWWLGQAMSLAFESKDVNFSTYVLARSAQRAAGGADQDRVLGLAHAATRLGASHRQVQAFAVLQRAHGHALAGETHQFETAIGQAQILVDGMAATDGKLGSFCTHAYVLAQEGEGWLRLKQPEKAAGSFGQALERWPAPHQRDRGLYLSRTAVAQLAGEHHDEAATTALEALKVANATRSMRIRQEVMTVGRQLAPFKHRPAAAALLAALATRPEDAP